MTSPARRGIPLRLLDKHPVATLENIRAYACILSRRNGKKFILLVGRIIFGIRIDLIEKCAYGIAHYFAVVDSINIVGLQFLGDSIECVEIACQLIFR